MATINETLPTLESGDRLTRAEFHARYRLRHDIKKAELIYGVVYVGSPVRFVQHGKPQSLAHGWVFTYAKERDDVEIGENATVLLGDGSEVQPDILVFRARDPQGHVEVTEDGYLDGAPDLVIEITASTASYDLHDKLRLYEEAGVREYIAWRTVDKAVDWFRWQDGRFVRVEPDSDGMIESSVFPGLRLDVPALLAGDRRRLLAALSPI